jgi:malate dehydrogenase (oxaloacetate-decarboxylating)
MTPFMPGENKHLYQWSKHMKTFSIKIDTLTGEEYFEVGIKGQQLLNDPMLNKASGFTKEERINLGLEGLLRSGVSDIETHLERTLEAYERKTDDLERYIYLTELLNRNETLFYKMLSEHLTEMVPIVYTPVVGQACLQLSHITRRYRGVYITPDNIANIDEIFENVSLPEVYLIVVTDGERILGLGDLGSDGMGIPVGKVNLYVAAGGLHPACCLPICLDVGTNNQRLLADPLYLGNRHPRLTGDEYAEFIERFVIGVKRNFPNALLQWEDFAKHNAFTLLQRYHERILSFNDDIQGTGATALSALITAMDIKKSSFSEQRFVITGMGQAGVGIAQNILSMLREEGLSEDEARRHIFAVDLAGLLTDDTVGLEPTQKPFAQPRAALANWSLSSFDHISLHDTVEQSGATVLIGVTATAGMFTNEILAQMAKNTERPIIFALSNPTSKCECTSAEVVKATNGKGIMAAGSPFQPVEHEGKQLFTSQCNNMYVFPGVGLGALVSKTPKITREMFLAASKALSAMVTQEQRDKGLLLPDMKDIREVSFQVAKAVAIQARDAGLGRFVSDDQLSKFIRKAQWDPHYYPFRFKQNGYN